MQKSNISGYTLLEIIATTLVVGILAAIATPNWLGFINQQRLTQVNQEIYQSLASVQIQAKKESLAYTVELKNNTTVKNPQLAIYLKGKTATNWVDIGDSSKQAELLLTDGSKITFDYDGKIENNSDIQPLEKIRVISSSNPTGSKRCIIVKSILGLMSTGADTQCQ